MSDPVIRPAGHADLATLTGWLAAAGLPTTDLTTAHMRGFLVAEQDAATVGMVGLERFDDIGLLRSLVVDDAFRGAGIGAQLVAAIDARAAHDGVAELWLLTIDAADYFARLGFVARDRDDAPAAIRGSAEFADLCPGDAVLMSRYCVRSRSQSTS